MVACTWEYDHRWSLQHRFSTIPKPNNLWQTEIFRQNQSKFLNFIKITTSCASNLKHKFWKKFNKIGFALALGSHNNNNIHTVRHLFKATIWLWNSKLIFPLKNPNRFFKGPCTFSILSIREKIKTGSTQLPSPLSRNFCRLLSCSF